MITRSIITIGRSFGSGGRLIGQRLAELENIPFYDHQLINMAAEETGLSEERLESVDEMASSRLLYASIFGSFNATSLASGFNNMPINDKLFIAQSKIIRSLAEEGPCVIIGRCADYVLNDFPHLLRLYIHAPLEDRIQRALENYQMEASRIEENLKKIDKRRETYYNYYADGGWGKPETYDLTVNSSYLGIEETVALIAEIVKKKESQPFQSKVNKTFPMKISHKDEES